MCNGFAMKGRVLKSGWRVAVISIAIAVWGWAFESNAKPTINGDITAITYGRNQAFFTLANGYGPAATLILSSGDDIFVNGARAGIASVQAGMAAKVVMSARGGVSRIDVSGRNHDFVTTKGDALKAALAKTKWVWAESGAHLETVVLHPGGTVEWSLGGQGVFTWEVVPGELRIRGVTASGAKYAMTFNAALTEARIWGGKGPRSSRFVGKVAE